MTSCIEYSPLSCILQYYMKIVDKQWVKDNIATILSSLKRGDIVIYPTDKIYGIGCNALNKTSVQTLRSLKKRPEKPLSIIAPSKQWIEEYFVVPSAGLDVLPGPVTLIIEPRDPSFFPKILHPDTDNIGVRLLDHWWQDVITQLGFPCVTTSVNVSDEPHMISVDDIPSSFREHVVYCIYEGPINGVSSKKISLSTT